MCSNNFSVTNSQTISLFTSLHQTTVVRSAMSKPVYCSTVSKINKTYFLYKMDQPCEIVQKSYGSRDLEIHSFATYLLQWSLFNTQFIGRMLKAPPIKSLVLHFSVLQNGPDRGLLICSKYVQKSSKISKKVNNAICPIKRATMMLYAR